MECQLFMGFNPGLRIPVDISECDTAFTACAELDSPNMAVTSRCWSFVS